MVSFASMKASEPPQEREVGWSLRKGRCDVGDVRAAPSCPENAAAPPEPSPVRRSAPRSQTNSPRSAATEHRALAGTDSSSSACCKVIIRPLMFRPGGDQGQNPESSTTCRPWYGVQRLGRDAAAVRSGAAEPSPSRRPTRVRVVRRSAPPRSRHCRHRGRRRHGSFHGPSCSRAWERRHCEVVTQPRESASEGYRPNAPPSTRITTPRPIRTSGNRMCSQRSKARATGLRVATNRASTTSTATSRRNTVE